MVTESKELSLYQPNMTVTELRNLAEDFSKSGYFQDAKEMVQAVVKIQAGREIGMGPVYSMSHIYIVKGKIAIGSEVMGALIKRTGRYDYSVKKLDNLECILEFTDNGKLVYTSKFTLEDARTAQLIKEDSGWVKWPRAMLMSKALSQGARIVCPHVISGTYTPEDFGLEPDAKGEYQEPKVEVTKIEIEPSLEMSNSEQRRKIFAIGKTNGYTELGIRDILEKHYNCAHTEDLTKKESDDFIKALEYGMQIDEKGQWIEG
jgi:hypothetical protein